VTQSDRLLAYLYAHPGASSLEVTAALYIVNVTGRVSDLRAAGHDVVCARRSDGRLGYSVKEARFAPVKGEQVGAW
jgi:hypothetical protein